MECRYCTAASRAHASGSGGNCWTQKCAMPVWTPAPACSLSHYSRHKPSVKLRICHQRVQPWYCVSRTRLSALAAAPESAAGRIEGVETPSGEVISLGGPGSSLDLQLPRRRLQVSFTCNKCGGRTERLVNPHAWNKGTVFVQCGQCDVWHNIRDEAGLIDEMGPNSQKASNNEQSASLAGCDEHSS